MPGPLETNEAKERCQEPTERLSHVVSNHKLLGGSRFEEHEGKKQAVERNDKPYTIPERSRPGPVGCICTHPAFLLIWYACGNALLYFVTGYLYLRSTFLLHTLNHCASIIMLQSSTYYYAGARERA